MRLYLKLFSGDDLGNFETAPIGKQTTSNIAPKYKDASGNDITGTLAGLSAEMKEFYSNLLIKTVGPALVHAQFGDKEALPNGHGSTIEWRKWNDFAKATTPLTEGVTPTASTISVNPIRATLEQYGDWTMVTDKLKLTALDNVIVEITSKHAENAKLTLDTIVRNALIAGCNNAAFAGGVDYIYELSDNFTAKDAAKLATLLKNNNAPKIDGSYVVIVHPSVVYDLITSEGWVDVVKYNDTTKIFDGEVGKLYGIRFIESTEAKVVKGTKLGTGTAGGKTAIAVTAYDSTTHTATVANNTFVADELNGKKVMVHDVSADNTVVAEMTVSDTTTNTLVFSAEADFTIAAGDIIYSGDSALDGADYFVCLVLGKNAYKVVDINGANAEMIIKPAGSGDDPLNQRSSVGWKVDGFAAAVTNPAYIFKFYCGSSITGVKAND